MGRTNCSICRHQQRAEIDIAMMAGESDAAVARRWDLTPTAVTIHRAKHLVTSPANMTPARREAHEQALVQFAISAKSNRVARIQSLVDRLDLLMAERSKAYANVPGGASGLLVVRQREIGGEIVNEEVFDTMAVKEYRELLRQAAGELGEWDVTGSRNREESGTSVTVIQAVAAPVESPFVATADARPGQPRTLPAQSQTVTIGPLRQMDRELKQSSIRSGAGHDAALPVADDGGGEGEDAAPGGE